jgi:chemotaxis protein CheD
MKASGGSGDHKVVAGRRFLDPSAGTWFIKVYPGEYHVVTSPGEALVTILASCVAACIRDPLTGIGGMNHFMLPENEAGRWGNDVMSTRYGNHAMEKLINELIKAGCPRERMEVKVFGGANVIDSGQAVGSQNAEFILRYLHDENLRCVAHDLGGDISRRIQYSPANGRVVRRVLGRAEADPTVREENAYAHRLRAVSEAPSNIELFVDFRKNKSGDSVATR